jgi:predicted ester cyclase
MVAEDDMVAIRISFQVKHTGLWRGMKPSGKSAKVKGFRFFRLKDGKIIHQWAMIDGSGLQAQLSEPAPASELITK